MKWTEIKIKTTEEAYDAISEMLSSIGAGGVSIEDPNEIRREIEKPGSLDYADEEFLNSLGTDVVVRAYFSDEKNQAELIGLIKEKLNFISNFLAVGEGYVGSTDVDDEDWSTAWKKYYKPLKISERIVIKPSWEEYEKSEGDIVIEMDPGMAFGTGTHETTRMCGVFLERYVKKGSLVIDVGCGTGILSIIAAKLGAAHITAVDIDDVAVRTARENCRLNGVEEKVNIYRGALEDIEKEEKVDLIVANIIADIIFGFSESVPVYLKPGGIFITSGIIKERRQEIIDKYFSIGFSLEDELEIGEWVAMVFRCPDSL